MHENHLTKCPTSLEAMHYFLHLAYAKSLWKLGSSCEFPQENLDSLCTILNYSDLYYDIQTVIK